MNVIMTIQHPYLSEGLIHARKSILVGLASSYKNLDFVPSWIQPIINNSVKRSQISSAQKKFENNLCRETQLISRER